MNRLLSLVLLVCASSAGGCAAPVASLMVSTPNRLNPLVGPANPLPPLERLAGADESFQVPVGPPEATLSVSVLEPPDHGVPLGTILVLHGIYARGLWMFPVADMLAESGYRAVLVDLRGHGRSSGDFHTFGVQEARDLSQVIDALEERGLVAGKIGVYGISYGATTSIHLAGCDPRVQAVVAVAPFSTMRDEVPHFGRVMAPGVGLALSEEAYQRAIDDAGHLGGFNPDEASAVEAIGRTDAPVLIMHGENDWVVPHWHGERLHEAAPEHSELVSVPWFGHTAMWYDPGRRVAQFGKSWFDRHLR